MSGSAEQRSMRYAHIRVRENETVSCSNCGCPFSFAQNQVKWEQTREFIQAGDFSTAWMWTFSYSLVFLVVAALLVCYQPAAAGSGIPEIIGFLNGTRIKDIFKVIPSGKVNDFSLSGALRFPSL